ncbi:MAG: rod shape determining protein RodA [Thermomicrobiales bacterium]|jgi:rod shape determining protein RodA|nr:rod shape determining protein RodA [Thermomicrobiales bacterium]
MSSRWKDFDIYLLLTTVVVMGFGVVSIWSALGGGTLTPGNKAVQQALYSVVGVGLMFFIAGMDYRFFSSLSWILYFGALALLVLVLIPSPFTLEVLGARRWFVIGGLENGITIQPSEFGKLATILALAGFIASRGREMRDLGNFIVSMLIVGVPAILVFREPDLGSALVYGVIWLSMMLVTQTRKIYFGALALMAAPAFLFAWEFVFHDYQRERLLISYNPEQDPMGAGYNIIQARLSIGSGGIFGFGLHGGTQSQLELLKVRESDFIFAHASGMVGFVGMMALFSCYMMVIWRCLRVAETAKDSFGQCVAIGVTGIMFFQAFVNMGMNLGIMPVTGITLPFVSQGSSSLWTFLMAQGILQSILMRHRKLAFQPT